MTSHSAEFLFTLYSCSSKYFYIHYRNNNNRCTVAMVTPPHTRTHCHTQSPCTGRVHVLYVGSSASVRTEKQLLLQKQFSLQEHSCHVGAQSVLQCLIRMPCWSSICTTVFNKDAMLLFISIWCHYGNQQGCCGLHGG